MREEKALQKAEEAVYNINKEWFATDSFRIEEIELRLKRIAKQYKVPFRGLANEVLWLPDALR